MYLTINVCWTTILQRSNYLWITWQRMSKHMTKHSSIVPSKCYFNWGKMQMFNPLSTNPKKLSNTLKQFVGKLPTNCLSVFDHFVKLAFNGLNWGYRSLQKILYRHFDISNVRSYSIFTEFKQNPMKIVIISKAMEGSLIS